MVGVWIQKGGPVMYPLLVCSIVSIALILERTFFWTLQSIRNRPKVLARALGLVAEGKIPQAKEILSQTRDAISNVLLIGLTANSSSPVERMEMAASKELLQMQRFLPLMNTLITLAPLLGILGTVTGIIHSFELLGTSVVADPKAVSAGVAEALITTAAGLTIAIWTLLPYNHFAKKVDLVQSRMEHFATHLEVLLKENKTIKHS